MFNTVYKKIQRILVLSVCFFGLFSFIFAGDALAKEWIWQFNVPVEVNNMPGKYSKYVRVDVRVLDQNGKVIAKSFGMKQMKSGGNFSGKVKVFVSEKDFQPNRFPGEAYTYKASLGFTPSSAPTPIYVADDVLPFTKAKPGTLVVTTVIGKF